MMKHESGLSLLPTSRAFSQAAKIFFIYKHFSILWSFELSGWLFIMENTSFNENEIERDEKWQNFLLGFVAIFLLVKRIFSMANVKRVRRWRGKLNVVLERVNERKLQVLVSLTRSPSTFAISRYHQMLCFRLSSSRSLNVCFMTHFLLSSVRIHTQISMVSPKNPRVIRKTVKVLLPKSSLANIL
jgi:hypothetical protein